MGDADTNAGQYTQIFMNQTGTPDSLIDTITPSALPTPSTPAPPDVVQVRPASTSTAAAGTPVTIEGNYFNTTPTPQVFFGGVAATNVHVNWNGELAPTHRQIRRDRRGPRSWSLSRLGRLIQLDRDAPR